MFVTFALDSIISVVMKFAPIILLLLVFGITMPGRLAGQETTPSSLSVFDYLTREEGAKIQVDIDMTALLQNRKKAEYLPASLTDESGKSFEMEVRTRGKFRRRRCEIPPIKLKFRKAVLQAAQLDTMNEIKLVLPCAGKQADEELIVREYLVYRMFEALNPEHCVRARLIRLQIKDKSQKRPQKMLAMLIEHEEQVSGRLKCAVVSEWGVPPERFNAEQMALVVLFQYMVGNTDWDISACRNIMLLQPPDDEKILTIPYDFDFAGLVAAPYSSPTSDCGVRSVRDRCLMSSGVNPEALQQARQRLLDEKQSYMPSAEANTCIQML
ncbi:MAG: hypothetical protein IPM98_06405 [Lewinellaceae bacterium]|nr:hypothetical protein [Lewinellaceae bacterium]